VQVDSAVEQHAGRTIAVAQILQGGVLDLHEIDARQINFVPFFVASPADVERRSSLIRGVAVADIAVVVPAGSLSWPAVRQIFRGLGQRRQHRATRICQCGALGRFHQPCGPDRECPPWSLGITIGSGFRFVDCIGDPFYHSIGRGDIVGTGINHFQVASFAGLAVFAASQFVPFIVGLAVAVRVRRNIDNPLCRISAFGGI
jgi:hypothetical protein